LKKPSKILTILFVVALLFTAVPSLEGQVQASSPFNPLEIASQAETVKDWDLPGGGHYYTQTCGGESRGFSITDEDGIPFWTWFNRLGGISSLGYPVSRRFELNGYVCQATQRAILQWRPETKSISFVNVFDMLHDGGDDAWLESRKQVPKPLGPEFTAGLDWNGTVQKRLALLDAFPAIKAQYNSVANPIEMNGLPTSGITDAGDSYIIRCQRIVIQQWKKDMPWAKAGQVTVANGGDIAKEAGLIPVPAQMPLLPIVQTCGDEKEYTKFARSAVDQLKDLEKSILLGEVLATLVWSPSASNEARAAMEVYAPKVIKQYNACEIALNTLIQDIKSQSCVPGKYNETNQKLAQAVQKYVEGVQLDRQAFEQRNMTIAEQSSMKFREGTALLSSAALSLQ
jgi:hypothetical protein